MAKSYLYLGPQTSLRAYLLCRQFIPTHTRSYPQRLRSMRSISDDLEGNSEEPSDWALSTPKYTLTTRHAGLPQMSAIPPRNRRSKKGIQRVAA